MAWWRAVYQKIRDVLILQLVRLLSAFRGVIDGDIGVSVHHWLYTLPLYVMSTMTADYGTTPPTTRHHVYALSLPPTTSRTLFRNQKNKHVGPPYCRVEMYAGRVACWLLGSHSEYADGTDRRTDGRMDARLLHYLSARRDRRNKRRKQHAQTIYMWSYALSRTRINVGVGPSHCITIGHSNFATEQ